MKKLLLISIVLVGLISCTNADMKQWTTLGSKGKITCYSGGHLIYEGESTGKISTENSSDGWYFEDNATKELIRVSGDCIIKN